MSATQKYEDVGRQNAVAAIHQAMRTLREHWGSVSISAHRTDNEGNVASYELEFDDDDDDEEEGAA